MFVCDFVYDGIKLFLRTKHVCHFFFYYSYSVCVFWCYYIPGYNVRNERNANREYPFPA